MTNLFAVGFESLHDGASAASASHDAEVSLDDADVILFSLPIPPTAYEAYQGKPCLSDDQSFKYKEKLSRWQRELASAVRAGKTVFVELTKPQTVYVATGTVEYSGTGRNSRSTRHVVEQSNLTALPCTLSGVIVGTGTEILTAQRSQMLSQYWAKFRHLSWYEVRFASAKGQQPLLTTKNSEQAVSAIIPYESGGHVVILPAVNLDADRKHRINSIEFVRVLLDIDAQLRGEPPAPPPGWMSETRFQTAAQRRLQEELLRLQEAEAEAEAQRERTRVQMSLQEANVIYGLLFAQGKQLEKAVLRGLAAMGVAAQGFTDGESEFDAVFMLDGTRMLGEVEGRDSAAINIDKITQLERNIAEDFARDEVETHAKGVLFGNPQRLVPPEARTQIFTTKCLSSAQRNHFALILTHTMFAPATYLEQTNDIEYATACRAAISAADGAVVTFPVVPTDNSASRASGDTETRAANESAGAPPK
ncbi:MAG: hypothetical protein DWI59_04760 [Chloroflexi bacterium]|nr:MAG: hypothetical protein DWI59_04760 [Chloroflexota bacterium]